jgi:predicted metal-binding protein
MDIVSLCNSLGASKASEIPIDKITFSPTLIELCEKNTCGRFASNYTCPPYIGEISALIAKLKNFDRAVVWQNIYKLADSFDFEGMMDGQQKHNTMTLKIAEHIYKTLGRENVIVLTAGGCTICGECAIKTNEPCRHSEHAISSLESYGINVSEIGNISELKYINGQNTVTYFSGVFYN